MPFTPPAVGEIAVAGVLGDPGNGFGGIPVTLLSNIAGAVQMRFGSTPEELALTEWRDYATETPLWMRTGGTVTGERVIYAEYRDGLGAVTAVQTTVPPFDNQLGTDYSFPPSSAIQPFGSDDIWVQDFSGGHDAWVTYDYNGGDPNGANYFYAAGAYTTGGVGGGGYIWADASRWRIDTPEDPDAILPLLTYTQWGTFPDNPDINLNGTTAEFYLRGDGLDLKGGSADFWILDQNGRWHQREIVLNIGDGEWALNSIDIGYDVSGFENSYSWADPSAPTLDLSHVRSWGISFTGFPPGVEPTGVLGLDEFTITRRSMSVTGTAGADALVGGRGDDIVSAGDGADSLDGGEGADQLIGGLGDDLYYVDATDTVTEQTGAGFDIVYSTGSHTLSANVEAVYLLGGGGLAATGNDLANWIYGNTGNDHLEGLAGGDLLDGGAGNDVLEGGAGSDWLRGGAGDDQLLGGDDADQLEGGLGNDIYSVTAGDIIVEGHDAGVDLVYSVVDWTLAANVEDLRLVDGASGLTGSGNALSNRIYGTSRDDSLFGHAGGDLLDGGAGNDVLDGGADSDWLRGGDGDDRLLGGDGNDMLDGGAGKDILEGGSGNDEYWIDGDDSIIELAGGGLDIVHTQNSFVLTPAIEAVYMEGSGNLTGLGNSEANWIYGGTGSDFLFGYDGNDLLDGGAGNDVLDGGSGDDSLRGGDGDDLFIFMGAFGRDAIRGFTAGAGSEDRIQFSTSVFADFAAIQAASSSYLEGTRIMAGENWVYLIGVDVNSLHSNDFLLA